MAKENGGPGFIDNSLRSKRFRLVSEKRKTEERDSFARSLTLVRRSLFLNRPESLATQAILITTTKPPKEGGNEAAKSLGYPA